MAATASCPGADVVQGAAAAFIRAARSGSTAAFAAGLSKYADVNALALFALGKYRSKLPPARRDEYLRNARRYMAQFLADNSRRFGGSNLSVDSCKGNLIETSLDGGSKIVWRLSGSRIDDVRVSGIWLAPQLRQKFTGVIKRNHGDVTELIDYLSRTTTAELPQKKN